MSEFDTTAADLEALNQSRTAGWCDAAGIGSEWPKASTDVVQALRAAGYRCDNDLLLQAVNDEWIPSPERVNGRLSWTATAAVTLACALESRRLWLVGHPLHFHKWTLSERIVQLSEQNGGPGINDLERFDWPALLAILVQVSGDQGAVQAMAEAFKAKLQAEGIL